MGTWKVCVLLLSLFLIGCNAEGREPKWNAQVVKATDVPVSTTGTYADKISRVQKRAPELAEFIVKLYDTNASYQYTDKKLALFIQSQPLELRGQKLTRDIARSYARECYIIAKKFKLDRDIFIALVSHEDKWINGRGDTSKDGKPMPRHKWSWGLGQLQYETARVYMNRQGCPGLTEQDLVDFPLLNLYIVGGILQKKVYYFKSYQKGIRAYNGGDSGWHRKATEVYLDKVIEVYCDKDQWTTN